MKAKVFNRSSSSILRALFVVGGLAGIYYYRKSGGKLFPLVAAGVGQLNRMRNESRDRQNRSRDRIDRTGKVYSSSDDLTSSQNH